MNFTCEQCGKGTHHFKDYLDHYKKKHPGMLKRYDINHTISGIRLKGYALTPDILLKLHDWKKEDCSKIKEIK